LFVHLAFPPLNLCLQVPYSFFLIRAFVPGDKKDSELEKQLTAMQALGVSHPIFGLPPAFQDLPCHLATKG